MPRTSGTPLGHESIRKQHLQIGLYFLLIYFTFYLCQPAAGFANIPVQYLLKDKFKFNPEQISFFQLLIALPTYIAFLFGFIRDRWSPFGRGDRGVFWIFSIIGALCFGWLALGAPTYWRLLAGIMAATVAYRFLGASTQGLTAEVGKRRGMTGRLSTLWNVIWTSLTALSFVIGGWVSDHLKPGSIFGILGILTLLYFVAGCWRPAAVFDPGKTAAAEPRRNFREDVKRLFRHKPIWPAAAIWLLWSFAPGFSTPLLFYLSDHLKATATDFGLFNAIWAVSFIPTYLLYGYLCRKTNLRTLLWWGTIVAVPQMIPLLFLKTPTQALVIAVPIGLSGGVATAAYIDLLLRSCPKKLDGTAMMIADSAYYAAVRFGDLFGAWLYVRGGFALAAWITTGVYALIIPLLFLAPKSVTQYHDADEKTEELLAEGLTDGSGNQN
jgi:MFS family permease